MGKGKRNSKNKKSKKTKAKRNEPKAICDNKAKCNPFNEKKEGLQKPHGMVKKIVSTLVTVVIVPIIITQVLNIYNANKAAEEALQAKIQQIYVNYEAGNYSEMQQDIYNVYPQLQKKKDYETLVSLSDMLIGSLYQEFYRNQSALPKGQEELILLYVNNALGYAEKLKDTSNYIKFCIHMALFNISEYEFTLNVKYLDRAEVALNTAGDFYDKNHDKDKMLRIEDNSEANLACQFFNLKNLQYQVAYYRVAIGLPYDESPDDVVLSSQTVANKLLNDLGQATIQLMGSVYIIESENAALKLIPEDKIQHMKILAGVAYIEYGNLMYNFGDILPVILYDEEERIVYTYSDVNLCADLFSTLEGVAADIKNYEDLVKVYKSAETYFYLNYVTTSSDDILMKYNEIIEKLLALDPSGDILSSRIVETGNSFILDKYIANVESKLSEIAFESNPFAFSLLKYKLGTHYLNRALFRDKLGDVINAKLDYESAKKCYNTALLYFNQENMGIFEEIHRMQNLITERLDEASD